MKINSRHHLTEVLTLQFNSARQALYLLLASEDILPIQVQLHAWGLTAKKKQQLLIALLSPITWPDIQAFRSSQSIFKYYRYLFSEKVKIIRKLSLLQLILRRLIHTGSSIQRLTQHIILTGIRLSLSFPLLSLVL